MASSEIIKRNLSCTEKCFEMFPNSSVLIPSGSLRNYLVVRKFGGSVKIQFTGTIMVLALGIDVCHCSLKLNFLAGLQSIRLPYTLTYQGRLITSKLRPSYPTD